MSVFIFSLGVARVVHRETFINPISLRNINVHAQLPMEREKGRERTNGTERRGGYERRAFVAHQHSKYSVEGGALRGRRGTKTSRERRMLH